eukprot:c14982_g1_i1.p1 GENE.c14982_g1_i1~~c14982_g1_i1.p1  ORF type:complete len:312 (-),score=125.19 c14982_g1_i1:19-954(-)
MTTPLHWANVGEMFLTKARFHSRIGSNLRPQSRTVVQRERTDSDDNDNDNGVESEENESEISAEQRWYDAACQVTRTFAQRIILFMIDDVAFFGVIVKLCGFLSCDYNNDLQMTQVKEQKCLNGGSGVSYGIFAMLGLLYYVFTSFCYTNMQCEVQSEIVKDFDIQFDHQFTGIERLLKMSSACTMALFGSFRYVPQAVSFYCASGLLLLLSRQSSCTVYLIDFWRPVALWIVIYACFVSVVVIITETQKSETGLYVFGAGVALIMFIAVLRWRAIQSHVHRRSDRGQNPLLESLINSSGARVSVRTSQPV